MRTPACCRQLGIQDEQMPIAEMLYEDYLSGLTAETSIRRAKAAGADELDAAFQGQSSLRSDELRGCHRSDAFRELNWPEVDALQRMLIDGTIALGADADAAETQAAIQAMQRRAVQDHAHRNSGAGICRRRIRSHGSGG